MLPDPGLVVFSPPTAPAAEVRRLALPPGASAPLEVHSHGYTYVVVGNTLLSRTELERLLRAAAGPRQAVAAIDGAYQRAGYLLTAIRAEVTDKRVMLAVVRGEITKVEGASDVVRFFRGAEFDPDITRNALIRRNILADAYASRSGRGLRPSLAPGIQPGGTTLELGASEQPGFKPVSGNVMVGNYGSRYVGGVVLGENLAVHPGHGLEFTLGYAHGLANAQKATVGSRYDVFNAGASVATPWGFYGLSYSRSAYRIGTAGAPLYPKGLTEVYAFNSSQLLFASPEVRVSSVQNLTHVANGTKVFGGIYTLVDQDYNYAGVGLQIGGNTSLGGLSSAYNASIGGNLGLSGGRGTMTQQPAGAPVSRFHYWNAMFNWQQTLPQGWSGALSASGQWGLDTLPANQQWVLGGFGSLSAWVPGVLVGDGGYLLRASVQTPSWTRGGWSVNAQLFAEQGAVTTHYDPPGTPAWSMLADVGTGFTLTSPWKTQLSVLAARPVSNKNVRAATLNSTRSLYLLVQQPF